MSDSGGRQPGAPADAARPGGADGVAVLSWQEVASDPELAAAFPREVHRVLAALVAGGAALGWVEPPGPDEVAALVADVAQAAAAGDAALRAAYAGRRLAGLAYWRRYARPTNWPHADVEKIAVGEEFQGRGLGRALLSAVIDDARAAGIEVLTLDCRGDNTGALALYRSLGFTEYGRLPRFVAFGEARFDKFFCMLDLRDPAT